MSELLNEEYYNLGTDKIYIELWLKPQMDQIYTTYIKPYGGLWTSHQNDYCLSDWIEYKESSDKSYYQLDFYYDLKSCLVKYKKNSKLLCINTLNDYLNLKQSGFVKTLEKPIQLGYYNIVNEVIDYEKLCDFYNLLYVNPYCINTLYNYSIRTMYALSYECIEYYKPIDVDYENHKIKKIYEKEYLKEPVDSYYQFINYVKSLYKDIDDVDYNIFITKLYNEMKRIFSFIKDNNCYYNFNGVDDELLVKTVLRNIYREIYLEKQKTLLKK